MGLDQDFFQTIEYGEDERQGIDVFTPAGNANGKALLFIHGGGWSGGSRAQWHSVANWFRNEGYLSASIGYRLAPNYRYSAQLEDVRTAVSVLKERAGTLGFDPGETAVIGSSAGGHLAALLSAMPADETLGQRSGSTQLDTKPLAAVLYCPATDLRLAFNEERLHNSITAFIGEDETQNEKLYKQLSPVLYNRSKACARTLILHGDEDQTIPLEQSKAYHQMLLEDGVEAELVVLKGVGHGFGYGIGSSAQQQSLAHMARFLDSVFQ